MENEWTRKIEQLEAENKELKKYKKIVEEIESVHCGEDGEFCYNRRKLVKKLEQKYLKEAEE